MRQKKHFWFSTLAIIEIFALVISFSNQYSFKFNNQSLSNGNSHIDQSSSIVSSVQSSSYNTTFLPHTNLTINYYYLGNLGQIYNASILSIDCNNWYIHCDYFENTSKQVLPFDTVVNRTSTGSFYLAQNYYSWDFSLSQFFDFWLDTNNFDIGYELDYGDFILTVEKLETISMAGLGSFHAWKLMGSFDSILWIDVETGMIISFYFDLVGSNWFNLTRADFGQIQSGYSGPSLVSIYPHNNSAHPNITNIELTFASPYDIFRSYYQWDDGINFSVFSSVIITPLPISVGFHHLKVTVIDSLGYRNFFHYVFETDDDLPAIVVNYNNNSHIQSSMNLTISVINSNGSFYYNWNGGSITQINNESSSIPIPSSEGTHILNISAMSKTEVDLWYIKHMVFIVDNTPPILTILDPNNGSILKGTIKIIVSVSEQSKVTYKLNDGLFDSFIADKDQFYMITFPNLTNGSYMLNITASDEAMNGVSKNLLFDIYTSAFNWIWEIKAETPLTIDVVDVNGTTWFLLTVLSKIDQTFNITVISEETSPEQTEDMLYAIEFDCDYPNDILFFTFSFPLNESERSINNSFDVYRWVYWDSSSIQWKEIPTSYNTFSHAWEATFEGTIKFFGLLKTGDTTSLKSIEPGGGQIPSFGFGIAIIAFIGIIIILRNKTGRKIG